MRALFLVALSPLLTALTMADQLTVSFPDSPRFPVFQNNEDVKLVFNVQRSVADNPDELKWEVFNYLGQSIKSGDAKIEAGKQSLDIPLVLSGLPAGYFELRAQLSVSKVALPRCGSQPEGMASFGIVSPLSWLPLAHPDDSRFGIQGTNFIKTGITLQGDPYDPLCKMLGARWANLGSGGGGQKFDWATREPDHAGEYAAELAKEPPPAANYESKDQLSPLVCVYDLPKWAMDVPPGKQPKDMAGNYDGQSFPPKDYQQYADYLELVAKTYAEWRQTQEPELQEGYYQVGWEPDWHWKGTDEQFLKLYDTAYQAIHAGDPGAVVMGPGYGVLAKGVKNLERLLPLGLAKSLDGITIHGYYVPFGDPHAHSLETRLVSPEAGGSMENVRKVRALMVKYLKPGAKLIQTEWGSDYCDTYRNVTPALLRLQAAYVIRGHLIFLGEGCDATYFFYTADYGRLNHPGEDGYGLCFNLTMPKPSWGATDVSPKPVFMAACTLTRVLEGTQTIGPVPLSENEVCAYAFQRADQGVIAFWSKDDVTRTIKLNVGAPQVTIIDFVGNQTPSDCKDGVLEIESTKYPTYVLGVKNLPTSLSPPIANP